MRPIIIRSYKELRLAIAAARKAVGLKQLDVDHIAGVQSGYTGKLECGDKNFGEMSFDSILGALGVALVLAPSKDVVKEAGPQALPADSIRARIKKNARLGGLKRQAKLTPEQRSKIAVKMNKARWARVRKGERERLLRASKAGPVPVMQ